MGDLIAPASWQWETSLLRIHPEARSSWPLPRAFAPKASQAAFSKCTREDLPAFAPCTLRPQVLTEAGPDRQLIQRLRANWEGRVTSHFWRSADPDRSLGRERPGSLAKIAKTAGPRQGLG